MRLLLDTHIVLWWLADDPLLPGQAAAAIADAAREVIVSGATAWEISIKKAVGRLVAPDDFLDALAANEFGTLPITADHAITAGTCRLITLTRSIACSSPRPGRKASRSSAPIVGSRITGSPCCPWADPLCNQLVDNGA